MIGAGNPAEAAAFSGAASDFATAPNQSAAPIETMLRLAATGFSPMLRRWAETWLLEKCGITIVRDDEEQDNAASPATGNLL